MSAEDRGGVTFADCVVAIEEGRVLDDLPHPVRDTQRLLVLAIEDYAYVVPYVTEQDGGLFLKTRVPLAQAHRDLPQEASDMSQTDPRATRQDAPLVRTPLDNEERELIEAIEAEGYVPGPGGLTPERLAILQAAARATLSEPSNKVSIRLPRTDLSRLKARALREGIPYQTLIKSILHQAVQR